MEDEIEQLAQRAYLTFWAPVCNGCDCTPWGELHKGTRDAWIRVVRLVQSSTRCKLMSNEGDKT